MGIGPMMRVRAGIVAAGASGQHCDESAEGEEDLARKAAFDGPKGLSGGSKQRGSVLWVVDKVRHDWGDRQYLRLLEHNRQLLERKWGVRWRPARLRI